MGLNFNINLPGPFSYSARVTPPIGRTVRQVNRAAKQVAQRDRRVCSRPPAARPTNPRPQDRTVTDSGSAAGAIFLWLLMLSLVILVILGFGGFRL